MGESFTIQVSAGLIKQLAEEGVKKKVRKPKMKVPREPQHPHSKVDQEQITGDSNTLKPPNAAGRAVQAPLFLPVTPPPQPAYKEINAIRSVLHDSEKVLDRLKKQEEDMVQEVTQRAKDLHVKEFKLPHEKPMPCLEEKNACLECYGANIKNPLKCASLVQQFADCARIARQRVNQ